MHIHLGLAVMFIHFGHVLLAGTFWRLIGMHLRSTPVGQAMLFMY